MCIHTIWAITQPLKKSEILPFLTIWIDLENKLSEVSQRKTNTVCYYLYVESKN